MGGPITKRCAQRLGPVVCVLMLAVPLHAAGLDRASASRLEVERAPNAQDCPDLAAFESLVAQVRGRGLVDAEAEHYRVRFERSTDLIVATVYAERDGSTRALSDGGPSCEALARATAVSLVLLIDAEAPKAATAGGDDTAAPPAQAEPPAPAASAPPPSEPAAKGVELESASDTTLDSGADDGTGSVGVYAGASLLYGVTRPLGPALTAGATLSMDGVRVSAGVLWAFEAQLALGPGHVTTGLRGVSLEACWAPARGRVARFDLCSGLLAAWLRAEASGYSTNESRTRAWFALPIAATLTTETRPVSWQVSVGAALPWHAQHFRVDGVGVAYAAPRVAASFGLRANLELPW